MKQPFWKRWWSFFDEVLIEMSSSELNEHLEVLLVKGEYQLCTKEAIYSYGRYYDNFKKVFEKIHLPKDDSKVLVLGLGLASIPIILEKDFKKDYRYTAVELDDEIIRLASKYVLDEIDSEIQTIHADAFHYVNIDQEKYDMIAVDIFLSDAIPSEFETIDYLERVKHMLSDNGILILNRLFYYSQDKRSTELYFDQIFKKVFPQGKHLHVSGNWMLLSDNRFLK